MRCSVDKEYIDMVVYLADFVDLSDPDTADLVHRVVDDRDPEAVTELLQLVAQGSYQEGVSRV